MNNCQLLSGIVLYLFYKYLVKTSNNYTSRVSYPWLDEESVGG